MKLSRGLIWIIALAGSIIGLYQISSQFNADQDGFNVKDAIDPATMSYRHPYYDGYISKDDDLLPTSDPILAIYDHEQYSIVLKGNAADRSTGLVSLRMPDVFKLQDIRLLQATACRIFGRVLSEASHEAYTHLRFEIWIQKGAEPVQSFDVQRKECDPSSN